MDKVTSSWRSLRILVLRTVLGTVCALIMQWINEHNEGRPIFVVEQ